MIDLRFLQTKFDPLGQQLSVNVEWDNADVIRTLKEKVESVNIPVGEDEEYKDDSNEILKSICVEEEEESDSDSTM